MRVAVSAGRGRAPIAEQVRRGEGAEGVDATGHVERRDQLKVGGGGHTRFADEPEAGGGLGTGLSPCGRGSAGLAACTVMKMRLYANRKGFPRERAGTTVQ
ncbi:osmotically inducible protein C, partial [Enterobacter kobei]